MKLYIARHGQTNYNVLGLYNADPKVDVHLTEQGVIEAQNIAKKLQSIHFDAIYISELPRTRQTADFINCGRGLELKIDRRLNDIDNGFEGKSVEEYHALRNAAEDSFTFRYGDAESSEDAYLRTKDFLRDLRQLRYNVVLIVTSKNNFRNFRNIIDNRDPRATMHEDVPNTDLLIREF